jgi:hypothetical protein
LPRLKFNPKAEHGALAVLFWSVAAGSGRPAATLPSGDIIPYTLFISMGEELR